MIELRHLSKTYPSENDNINALIDITLTIEDKDIYGIIGMSGAGKSTLVRCINLLEKPDNGQIIIDGQDILTLSNKELRKMRQKTAMIFQSFNLLSQRNCIDNVCFPMELNGINKQDARKKALELLSKVELSDKGNSYPSQLSGGQQQRVAIARALATNPKILLCDEFTSALDPITTRNLLQLIKSINHEMGITIVVITHQMNVVKEICNKVAIIEKGRIVEKGLVSDIFSRPSSDAAKSLVYSTQPLQNFNFNENEAYFELYFNGADKINSQIISRISIENNVIINIINSSIKTIENKIYGSMLISTDKNVNQKEIIESLNDIPEISIKEIHDTQSKYL